ncbi:MAG TPA: histidine kinase [Allosphingosinicella sp.]|nr:histidine kinase [Allosphingosinicella sp.]
MSRTIEPSARRRDVTLGLVSIGGFWLFYFATVLLRGATVERNFGGLAPQALSCLFGAFLTGLLWLVLRRAAHETMRVQVIAAAIACLPAAAMQATFDIGAFLYQPMRLETVTEKGEGGVVLKRFPDGEFRIERPGRPVDIFRMPTSETIVRQRTREHAARLIAADMVSWYFFFAAWASFYIAMSAAAGMRNAERRAARAERNAQAAQLRALRYQVNPHFLFNTLNSLSSLVLTRRVDEAETMIVNLSSFFRSSLTLDPGADVTLAQEIELQELYLDIEKVRFPRRLKVRIEIPADLRDARVPPLILQPLVENAIKHGVARTIDAVTLTVTAREEDARLVLTVENDRGPGPRAGEEHGTGVGLANVCDRLAARFGTAGECAAEALADVGWRVTLAMPLETDG